ncbi:MAG: DUF5615 family PIN-like protein [Candidatus Schekmanbacteria bacterium]|nr:DUF5615 family PIN-like protein [Candidatus Schekmanbacteria bacterium]
MKFLTDENISTFTVSFLRNLGHDVKDIKEQNLHGIDDTEVLALAQADKRILITLDKGLGKLVHLPPQKHAGIVLLRISPTIDVKINQRLAVLFERHPSSGIEHKFVVVTNQTVRIA